MFKWGLPLFAFAIVLRLVQLSTLPGEWYGDISIVHHYVHAILTLHWPIGYRLSAGPLYHYLIAPLIALLGYSYLSYKLASVLVSLLGLGVMAWVGHLVGGRALSLTTLFVGACSSWFLIFSRLGNSQILIPAVTAATLGVVLVCRRAPQPRWIMGGAVIAATGFYVYPQTSIVPAWYLFLLLVFVLWPRPSWDTARSLVLAGLTIAVLAIPLTLHILAQPENFVSGYLGSKFFSDALPLTTLVGKFLAYLRDTLWMLHGRGDIVFRSNPPHLAHLDPVSGGLLLLGILVMARHRTERPVLGVLLMSILILIIPAAWPNLPAIEVPSASRTIGILPMVYLLVARGLVAVYAGVMGVIKDRRVGRRLAFVLVGVVGGSIIYLNLTRYFVLYADYLPYHNVAFGAMIGQAIDRLPQDTRVFVIGCCWSDWAMPQEESIQFATTRQDIRFVADATVVCDTIGLNQTVHVFFSPLDDGITETLRACAPLGTARTVRSGFGDPIYSEFMVERIY